MARKGSWTDGSGQAGSGGSVGDAADSPFAALAKLRESLPAATPSESARPAAGAPAKAGPARPPGPVRTAPGPARAVVRLERKGRGGKDATLITHLGLAPAELEVWTKALKAQLGCGGAVEGDEIVLQGDLRKRVGPLLEARGVRKVTIG